MRSDGGREGTCAVGQRVEKGASVGVCRTQREALLQLFGSLAAGARLRENDGEIEAVVGVVRIGLCCLLKILSGFFLLAQMDGDCTHIAVDLGQRQAQGDKVQSAFSARKVSNVISSNAQIEICFARPRIGRRNMAQRRDRLIVLVLVKVRAAQAEPCLVVRRIQANGFAEVRNSSLRSSRW